MTSSFRKIDYSLRPAKYAERKMLAEVFRRLSHFGPVEDYVYVGFGSVWFSDFILFHRALGIREMISFEQSSGSKDRFEANKPYRVDVRYMKASKGLTTLDWQRHHFIWLDYDTTISGEVLSDARTVATEARSGTLLAVSIQCVAASELEDAANEGELSGIERFRQAYGRDRVGDGIHEDDLYGWPFGRLSRSMIFAEIEQSLSARNAQAHAIDFYPVCEIEYQDDAKMTTLVGVFVAPEDKDKFTWCEFDRLDFVPDPSKPVRIEMPKLTVRELRQIEQQLPIDDVSTMQLGSIPMSEAKNFARIYRYFPNFSVVES